MQCVQHTNTFTNYRLIMHVHVWTAICTVVVKINDIFYNAVAVARCEYYSSRGVPLLCRFIEHKKLIDTLCVNEIYAASLCRLKKLLQRFGTLCANVTRNASTFLTLKILVQRSKAIRNGFLSYKKLRIVHKCLKAAAIAKCKRMDVSFETRNPRLFEEVCGNWLHLSKTKKWTKVKSQSRKPLKPSSNSR